VQRHGPVWRGRSPARFAFGAEGLDCGRRGRHRPDLGHRCAGGAGGGRPSAVCY